MPTPIRAHAPAAPAVAGGVDAARALALGRSVLATEAMAIDVLQHRLGDDFVAAADAIPAVAAASCHRASVSATSRASLAATLRSLPRHAGILRSRCRGGPRRDLGMITPDDAPLLLSNSGETDELLVLLPHLKRQGARLIALTGNEQSSLAQAADIHLDASVDSEACPLGLAPTASTTAALALGDALALTVLDARGFSVEDFARSHPGGTLGRRMLTRVHDVMRTGVALPVVAADASLADAVVEMSGKGMGMTAVVDAEQRVAGIFTDGDLRRSLNRVRDFSAARVAELMTRNPRTIAAALLAINCVELMETPPKVSQLLVVDGERRLVGALHMHDLFRAKVV
jgi:arabinose-5-phosphate isomerase